MLQNLFAPLIEAIKSGHLSAFDKALERGEAWFVRRRIYLTLERGRDVCLRNLLRKVYMSGDLDENGLKSTRVKLDVLIAAIRLSEGWDMERDEVECLIANIIYRVSTESPALSRAS